MKKIHIASDHAGYELKLQLQDQLKNEFIFQDHGPFGLESVDYPDFAHLVCHQLNQIYESSRDVRDFSEFGVLICGSGQGMNITANKYKNLRSALCYNEEITKLARSHNDVQVMCLGARFISLDEAKKMIRTFAATAFEGGRHQNRVNKIGQCL